MYFSITKIFLYCPFSIISGRAFGRRCNYGTPSVCWLQGPPPLCKAGHLLRQEQLGGMSSTSGQLGGHLLRQGQLGGHLLRQGQ
jgi:hypothetical protein